MGNSPITEVLQDVAKKGDDGQIDFGEIVEALESRGFGPLLFIPSFIMVTPVGAIPGVPSVCALIVLLIAGQLLFGRHHPWIPSFIHKVHIKTPKYKKAIKWAGPALKFIEKHSRKRLAFLTHDTAQRVVAFVSVLLACAVPPLEVLPFAVFVPGFALLLFSLGFILRDGIVTLLGFLVTLPVFYLVAQVLL